MISIKLSKYDKLYSIHVVLIDGSIYLKINNIVLKLIKVQTQYACHHGINNKLSKVKIDEIIIIIKKNIFLATTTNSKNIFFTINFGEENVRECLYYVTKWYFITKILL